MPSHAGKLSVRQERFVAYYSQNPNAAEAARLAGYSAKTARVIGPENLSKPAIRDALEARQRVFREELRVAKEDVIAGLLGAIQLARSQQNPAAMIAGLVQITKLCGFYATEVSRVEVSTGMESARQRFTDMSDEELLALISARK